MLVDVYTGDSDPVYWAIDRARQEWGYSWAAKFCVGMLSYYHTGVAVQAANCEGDRFWKYLNAIYPTAPRGSERRHLRGDGGLKTLAAMEQLSPDPTRFFGVFPPTYEGIQSICERYLYAFGPYFQLKICDYMDRCLGIPIRSYTGLSRNLPTEPARAVDAMYPEMPIGAAFLDLCKQAQDWNILAAPDFRRLIGPAEIETSLCGWRTTKYKGNWFGADIEDKRNALKGYGERAERMAYMMPPLVPRDTFRCEL